MNHMFEYPDEIETRYKAAVACSSESKTGTVLKKAKHLVTIFLYRAALFLKGCRGLGEWTGLATWFPGFVWRVCVCPQCGAHLGWMFEPEDLLTGPAQDRPSPAGFYAIILDKVIDENFAESITLAARHLH